MNVAHLVWQLLTVFLLILANAFFVAAEFSFVSVRRTRIDQLAEEGNPSAKQVRRLLDDPTRFLSSTQLGVTLASLGLGWLGEPVLARLIDPALKFLGSVAGPAAHTISIIVSFSLISYFLMVLGELVPKTLGLNQAERIVLIIVWMIEGFYWVFRPFIGLLNVSARLLLGIFGLKVSKMGHMVHSEEELKMLVQASHEGGAIEADEQALLKKAFDFSDTTVDEVMIPRPDMLGVSADASFEEIVALTATSHHTRLPVYEGDIDHIVGFVHVKDLLERLAQGAGANARTIMRPILMVPEKRSIADMLKDFRRHHTQVAIVIDEFGGTAGMVTSKDLLEELVGEISDEFDIGGPLFETLPDGTVTFDGRTPIDDINERFGLDLPADEFNTIAGLIFGEIGHTPEVGDEVELKDRRFRVEATNGRRATLIRMFPASSPDSTPV